MMAEFIPPTGELGRDIPSFTDSSRLDLADSIPSSGRAEGFQLPSEDGELSSARGGFTGVEQGITKKRNWSKKDLMYLLQYLQEELNQKEMIISHLQSKGLPAAEEKSASPLEAQYWPDPFMALQRDAELYWGMGPAGGSDPSEWAERRSWRALQEASRMSLSDLNRSHSSAQQRIQEQVDRCEETLRTASEKEEVATNIELENTVLRGQLFTETEKNRRLEKDVKRQKKYIKKLEHMCGHYREVAVNIIKERRKLVAEFVQFEQDNAIVAELLQAKEDRVEATETARLCQMEAETERRLLESDIEREQLRARLAREEGRCRSLTERLSESERIRSASTVPKSSDSKSESKSTAERDNSSMGGAPKSSDGHHAMDSTRRDSSSDSGSEKSGAFPRKTVSGTERLANMSPFDSGSYTPRRSLLEKGPVYKLPGSPQKPLDSHVQLGLGKSPGLQSVSAMSPSAGSFSTPGLHRTTHLPPAPQPLPQSPLELSPLTLGSSPVGHGSNSTSVRSEHTSVLSKPTMDLNVLIGQSTDRSGQLPLAPTPPGVDREGSSRGQLPNGPVSRVSTSPAGAASRQYNHYSNSDQLSGHSAPASPRSDGSRSSTPGLDMPSNISPAAVTTASQRVPAGVATNQRSTSPLTTNQKAIPASLLTNQRSSPVSFTTNQRSASPAFTANLRTTSPSFLPNQRYATSSPLLTSGQLASGMTEDNKMGAPRKSHTPPPVPAKPGTPTYSVLASTGPMPYRSPARDPQHLPPVSRSAPAGSTGFSPGPSGSPSPTAGLTNQIGSSTAGWTNHVPSDGGTSPNHFTKDMNSKAQQASCIPVKTSGSYYQNSGFRDRSSVTDSASA